MSCPKLLLIIRCPLCTKGTYEGPAQLHDMRSRSLISALLGTKGAKMLTSLLLSFRVRLKLKVHCENNFIENDFWADFRFSTVFVNEHRIASLKGGLFW